MGGAKPEGTRAWELNPPPVLSVRPRGLKLPSSRGYWLSDNGELSYELEYAAMGPGGGRPVEFMPVS